MRIAIILCMDNIILSIMTTEYLMITEASVTRTKVSIMTMVNIAAADTKVITKPTFI